VEEERPQHDGHGFVRSFALLVALLVRIVVIVLSLATITDSPLSTVVYELLPPPLPASVTDRDASVIVTVRDEQGEPVRDARVQVLSEIDDRVYRAGAMRTSASGVARIGALPRGHAWVVADATSHARASTSLVIACASNDAHPCERHVDLVLGPEHSFVVNVVDTEGRGVPNAEIEVTSADALPYGARTDAQGRAEVLRLGAAPWIVTVRALGYDETTARNVRDGAALKLVLHRLGSILVHVVSVDDKPVPNARVRIAGAALWPAREGHTGEHGMVKLAGLFTGSYALRATEGTRASAIELGVMLSAGDNIELTLRLLPGRMVQVHVTDGDAEDAPDIAGARVVLAEAGISPFPLEAVTDKHGRAQLGPIAPGSATLSARADGFIGRGAVTVPEVLAGEVRVVLVRAGALVGRVVDARGFPVASATIELVGTDFSGGPIDDDPRRSDFRDAEFHATLAGPAQLVPAGELGVVPGPVPPIPRGPVMSLGMSLGGPRVHTAPSEPWVTASDGTFRATPATPGRVRALVRHPEYVEAWSETVTIPAGGEAHVEIVLHTGGSLEGRVVDSQGRPVSGARIELAATHGTLERTTKSSSDGSFAFASVPVDVSLDVYEDDEALAPALRTQTSVKDGERREIVLTLPAARDAMLVRVKDDRGYPVASAQVSIASLDPTAPLRQTAFSDARGEATLTSARGLPLRVEVSAPGHAPSTTTLDTAPAEVELALGLAATVTGTVRSSRGVPIADADVVFYMESTVRHLRTDAQGVFSAADLAPGSARVLVRAAGYATTERTFTVGQSNRPSSLGTIDLASEAVVFGEVRDARGDPVPGARVAKDRVPVFLAASATPPDVATTDSQGRFRLGGLGEGTVTLEAIAPDIGRGRVDARMLAGRSTTNVRIVLAADGVRAVDHAGATVAVTLGETGGATESAHEVVIVVVAEGSEAEHAGLLAGDVIADVDGTQVHTIEQAREKLGGPAGVDVVVGIHRDGSSLRLRVGREVVRR